MSPLLVVPTIGLTPPSLNSLDLSNLSTHKSAIATVDSDIFKRPLGSKKDSV